MLPNSKNDGTNKKQGDTDPKKQPSQSDQVRWDVKDKVEKVTNPKKQ
jgi:hypothetical protein